MIDTDIKITPEVYQFSVKLGTTDYKAVVQAVQIAKEQAAAGYEVVITNSGSGSSNEGAASSEDSAESKESELVGYTKVDTISVGGGIHICIYKGPSAGYGAYECDEMLSIVKAIDSTEGYDGSASNPGTKIVQVPVYVWGSSVIDPSTTDPVVPGNSSFIATEAEIGLDPAVTVTADIDSQTINSEGATPVTYDSFGVQNEAIADTQATASTTYDVEFKFNDATDDSVSFNVAVEGSDGFVLEDQYNVDNIAVSPAP